MTDPRLVPRTTTWVFGYGSLVSPTSMATTIGRSIDPEEVLVAQLQGYGRRWNYGAMHVRGNWIVDGQEHLRGVIVALGLVAAEDERCNGVVVEVTDDELARLDHRERDYARADVTSMITAVRGVLPAEATVVTYVPSAGAIGRYEQARNDGRAAVRRDYWELVEDAFAALGPEHLAQFLETPAPDVPIVDVQLVAD